MAEARRELERGLAAAELMGVGIARHGVGRAAHRPRAAGNRRPRRRAGDPSSGTGRGTVRDMELPSLTAETEARIRLVQGDLAWASRWARDAHPEAPAGSPLLEMLRRSVDLTLARIALAEGRPADALVLLAPTRAAYESWGTVPELISTHVLEAVAHGIVGRRDEAVEALGAASGSRRRAGTSSASWTTGPACARCSPASGRLRRRSWRRSKARWLRRTTTRGNRGRAGARRSRWALTASWSSR